MQRSSIASLVLGTTLIVGCAGALAAEPSGSGNTARGKQLYMATGCYQCHGTRGEGGGNAGPRLAPSPLPYEGFMMQIRKPRARMPFYTEVVMSAADVADIYAYLLGIPKGKTVDEIPILKNLSAGTGRNSARSRGLRSGRLGDDAPNRFQRECQGVGVRLRRKAQVRRQAKFRHAGHPVHALGEFVLSQHASREVPRSAVRQ